VFTWKIIELNEGWEEKLMSRREETRGGRGIYRAGQVNIHEYLMQESPFTSISNFLYFYGWCCCLACRWQDCGEGGSHCLMKGIQQIIGSGGANGGELSPSPYTENV